MNNIDTHNRYISNYRVKITITNFFSLHFIDHKKVNLLNNFAAQRILCYIFIFKVDSQFSISLLHSQATCEDLVKRNGSHRRPGPLRNPRPGLARQVSTHRDSKVSARLSQSPRPHIIQQNRPTKTQKQRTIEPYKCIYVLPCEPTKKTCDYETKVAAKAQRFSIENDTKQHFVDKSGVTECFNRQCVVEDIVESVFCCICPLCRKGGENPMEYANKLVSFNPHIKSSALDSAVRFVLQIFTIYTIPSNKLFYII